MLKTIRLPSKLAALRPAEAEALLRRHPDVLAAEVKSGYARLWLSAPAAAPVTAPRAAAPAAPEDIASDMQGHRRQALLSLGVLGAVTLLRRFSPALFAATTVLRGAAVLALAAPFLKTGLGGLITTRRPNADTLTVTAVLASIVAGRPESSLTLLTLSNWAEMLTTMAAQKARANISRLMALDVREVWIRDAGGAEYKIPIESVQPGMLVQVHAGEKICVDGEVCEGRAAVDQAAITGESVPVEKNPGDKAYAGTVVALGEITIKVSHVGDDTSLARIVHMVEQASSRRAPVQNYADHMATALLPVSFLSALMVYLCTRDVQRALNLLFIDFSCGLKLSTATAISAAVSRAARQGILVKGGSFIEQAAGVDTVLLDKTGTITRGRPMVVNIVTAAGHDENTILRLAASAEEHSTHPMALAVLGEAESRGLKIPRHRQTDTVVGRGIRAVMPKSSLFSGGEVLVGSRRFMNESGIECSEPERKSPAGSFIYVAAHGKLLGILEIDDPVREDFKRAINRLRNQGIEEITMLTGDQQQVAMVIASRLGLDGYQAEILPEQKALYVSRRHGEGKVLMVGDGINDAPALAYADIGVAMGRGCTDTAMETADVTINSDDPLKLPEFIRIGRQTMHIVHQNFAVTIAVNSVAMMLGALGYITPLWSSVVHNASTLGVVLNSVRVLLDGRHQSARQTADTAQDDGNSASGLSA